MTTRVADYIMDALAACGVRHVFLVTGGGAMHLNDAIGRCKAFEYTCCHHEQACAMAAEAYSRVTGIPALVNVTTGPGGINALNGVFGAYTDSVPMVVVSGQVKRETCMAFYDLPGLRQLGDQEVDIVAMARGITKYAAVVTDPKNIRYEIEKAFHLATTGRPGPTWIDVPIDIQGARVDLDTLHPYEPPANELNLLAGPALATVCQTIRERCERAARPVILAGAGIRAAGARDLYIHLLDHWRIPAVTAWGAHDVLWNSHPCYVGRPSPLGDRAGNFAVQNSDVLLALGSRLNVRQVSYNWKSFARAAFKIMVDIDAAELTKPTVTPDLPVHADVNDILRGLLALPPISGKSSAGWLDWCLERRKRYPVVLPEYWDNKNAVNPYCFVEALYKELASDDIVVCGDGTACVTTFQAADIQRDQRLFTNSGCASMGYDLPGAIGACFANGRKRIICLAGDGSIQLNLQELQTIATHKLPIKLFVLNNQGYHSIRQTQRNFFPDNIVGCGEESGLNFPSFRKLADVYGMPYASSHTHADLPVAIRQTLALPGAAMCEIFLDLEQQFAPKLSSRRLPDGSMVSSPLEDLSPFLDRDELKSNMLIPAPKDS